MNVFLRFWAILVIALKRLIAQKWLSLSILVGLTVSIALVMSIPMYSDGVYYRVLTEELSRISEDTRRPPFAFLFQYIRNADPEIDWATVEPADSYIVNSAASDLGLPLESLTRYFRTGNFQVFPVNEAQFIDSNTPLFWASFAYASDIGAHIDVFEGAFPQDAGTTEESRIEVLIHENLALELGLQVGESYIAFAQSRVGSTVSSVEIPVQVAGVWRPIDPASSYWFYHPDSLKDNVIVTAGTFFNRLSPQLDNDIDAAVWYMVMDGSQVDTSDVGQLLARFDRVQFRVTELLPRTLGPLETERALSNYRQDAAQLSFLLFVFSIPILSLMIVFIGLVVGLSVARRQNEIAVLRSRGGSELQVIGIAALEALILGSLALLLAMPLSVGIALLVSNTRSFLDFSLAADMRILLSPLVIRTGLAAVLVTIVAQVIPTIGASLHTIVSYNQARARAGRPPWWQRTWLDLLLLIPVFYGLYLLQQQGGIISAAGEQDGSGNPLQNPLFLLIPSLTIFAFTLLVLRILPYLMSLITRLTFRSKSVGILMAARHLARTPSFYSAPLIMLILTFGLATFIASLARTIDSHLFSQQYYAYGADMNVLELGESTERSSTADQFLGLAGENNDSAADDQQTAPSGPRFLFLPVSEHLEIPGVSAAARVGNYLAFADVSGRTQPTQFIGVDRADFVSVGFWRDDFASESLGELMNRLALVPNGVLVDQSFIERNGIGIGDSFAVEVLVLDQRVDMDVEIVGVVEQFPTWYPLDDRNAEVALAVGNLDTLFEFAGGTYPYDVWLRVSPDADYEAVVQNANERGLGIFRWDAPLLDVAVDQRQPERQGLFGVLSVGFIAAIFLTVLGFFLYSFFSFRRRFVELGVLRAIGLSSRQMTRFLAWELIFLIVIGIVVGTSLGIGVSHLFIPYLQTSQGLIAQYPSFLVQISWEPLIPIYGIYAVLFLLALGVLVFLMLRMRIFEAIKLGETT
jgi:putative ABC transport system permease protein